MGDGEFSVFALFAYVENVSRQAPVWFFVELAVLFVHAFIISQYFERRKVYFDYFTPNIFLKFSGYFSAFSVIWEDRLESGGVQLFLHFIHARKVALPIGTNQRFVGHAPCFCFFEI